MKLTRAKIVNVVALMGTVLTPDQENLLLSTTDKIKLWLDNNKTGKKALQNILRTPEQGGTNGLIYKTHVKIISAETTLSPENIGNRKKPYEFTEEEIKKILTIVETRRRLVSI